MLSPRVNYAPESEQVVNNTIQLLQSVSLTYDLLGATCATEEVSMPGFCKFYRLCSLRTRKMSEQFINWQTMRGGKLSVTEIKPLVSSNELWHQGLEKLAELAVDIEKRVEEQLRHVHQVTMSKEDMATSEYVNSKFLIPQVVVIKMMVNHANGLKVSKNQYIFDRHSMMPETKQIRRCIQCCGNDENCTNGEKKIEKTTWSTTIKAFTQPII
ncbi:Ferritin [Fasciolopsis buskii]|uniref:Ferritin n=1 Tax=Fasciolopsis buskii TaxID=27845 RepID=A0A8E0RQM7_9TREM|nr:Ferritin [Fasciolopsis buski]